MSSATQVTLLERLRDPGDPVAWDEFFQRYWRLIYAFARRRGCGAHTAEEVVQDVMMAVFRNQSVFQYDPARGRFRDWLATVVRHRIVAIRRKVDAQRTLVVSSPPEPPLDSGVAETADAAWESAFEISLLGALLEVVRREVAPETFQAFELVALQGLSGADAARATGLTRNAVYLARRRIEDRLKQLGADYRDEGQLSAQLREALRQLPEASVQRSVTNQVEVSMTSLRETPR